jgi:hypothetical protein
MDAVCGVVGGLVGSSIVALSFALISPEFKTFRNWASIVMAGTALGILLEFAESDNKVLLHIGSLLPLFLAWQTTVAAVIAYHVVPNSTADDVIANTVNSEVKKVAAPVTLTLVQSTTADEPPELTAFDEMPPQSMLLKLRRYERRSGIMGKPIFGLDARLALTAEELALVRKYGFGNWIVYDSTARKKHDEAKRAIWKARRSIRPCSRMPIRN